MPAVAKCGDTSLSGKKCREQNLPMMSGPGDDILYWPINDLELLRRAAQFLPRTMPAGSRLKASIAIPLPRAGNRFANKCFKFGNACLARVGEGSGIFARFNRNLRNAAVINTDL